MDSEKLEVTFSVKESEYDNCLCDCCHGTGHVLKVKMPTTLYKNGKDLTTNYSNLWLCNDCRKKLSDVLLNSQKQ